MRAPEECEARRGKLNGEHRVAGGGELEADCASGHTRTAGRGDVGSDGAPGARGGEAPAEAGAKRTVAAWTLGAERGTRAEGGTRGTEGHVGREAPAAVVGAGRDRALEPATDGGTQGNGGTAREAETGLGAQHAPRRTRTPTSAPVDAGPRRESGSGGTAPANTERSLAAGEDGERVRDPTAQIGANTNAPALGECPQRHRARKAGGGKHGHRGARAPGAEREVGPGIGGVEVEHVTMSQAPVTRADCGPNGGARGVAPGDEGVGAVELGGVLTAQVIRGCVRTGDVGEIEGRGGDGDAGMKRVQGKAGGCSGCLAGAGERETAVGTGDPVTLDVGNEADGTVRGWVAVDVAHVRLDGRVGVAHRGLGVEGHQSLVHGVRGWGITGGSGRGRGGRIVAEGTGLAEELASARRLRRDAQADAGLTHANRPSVVAGPTLNSTGRRSEIGVDTERSLRRTSARGTSNAVGVGGQGLGEEGVGPAAIAAAKTNHREATACGSGGMPAEARVARESGGQGVEGTTTPRGRQVGHRKVEVEGVGVRPRTVSGYRTGEGRRQRGRYGHTWRCGRRPARRCQQGGVGPHRPAR